MSSAPRYVASLFMKDSFKVAGDHSHGGDGAVLNGFGAGILGIGVAIRGALLAATDLPRAVYIATAGAIGPIIDSGRIATYL